MQLVIQTKFGAEGQIGLWDSLPVIPLGVLRGKVKKVKNQKKKESGP